MVPAIFAGVAGLVVIACTEEEPIRAQPAPLPDDAGLAAGICPDTAPSAGDVCSLPEGTTCSFDSCGTEIAECRGGAWRYGGNTPPPPVCPSPEPPQSDSPCPPCWPAGFTCSYGSCAPPEADASSPRNTAVASCPGGTWQLVFTACPILDAGPDVQDDSGSEHD